MNISAGVCYTAWISDYIFRYGIKTMFHCAGSPVGSMAGVHCAATLRDFVCMENHAMDMDEAVEKRIISRGAWYNHGGPWVHLDEEGHLVNRADPR